MAKAVNIIVRHKISNNPSLLQDSINKYLNEEARLDWKLVDIKYSTTYRLDETHKRAHVEYSALIIIKIKPEQS